MIRPGVDAAAAFADARASAPASSKVSCPSSARFRWSPRAPPRASSPPTISAPTRIAPTSSMSRRCPPASRRRPRKRRLSIARRIADALDYVGVLAVEMFLVRDPGGERLVVNEIAPRVHNSGHWTIEGALTSQFEQHVRAVCGWPLGATDRLGRVEMHNLIGEDAGKWAALLAETGCPPASLRQGTGKARPQDGARDPRFPGKRLIRPAFKHPPAGHLFCGADPWTSRAVLITTPPTVEVRRTRLLSLLVQSKRLQHTRKTRAGSCPG